MKVKNCYSIALYDSGIGGLNVLKLLHKYLPYENYLYLGDNHNAPYGNKDIKTLYKLAVKNINKLLKYKIKVLVLACNTLSTTIYEKLCKKYKIKIINTHPLLNIKNSTLICTNNTANSEFIIKNNKFTKVIPLSNLALDIERNIFNLSNVKLNEIIEKIDKSTSYIILGCTHYAFVLNYLKIHLNKVKYVLPEYISMLKVYSYLKEFDLFNNSNSNKFIKFIGESKDFNEKVYYEICLKNTTCPKKSKKN